MKKLSELDELEFVREAQKMYKSAMDATYEWRKEAAESRGFVNGSGQWSDADRIERGNRPTVTYNRTGPFVDAVVGMYIQNRQEARYLPRTLKDHDPHQAEVLNYAAEWARDLCGAEDEEVDAFLDLVVTGLGVTDTGVSFEEDPEGRINETRADWVTEIFWDPNARQRGYIDRRWTMRVSPWEINEIQDEWGEDVDISGGDWYDDASWAPGVHRADRAWLYKNDAAQSIPRDVQMVVCLEWYEVEKKHRVIYNGQKYDIGLHKFRTMRSELDQSRIPYTTNPIPHRTYYRAYITGNKLLERKKAPVKRFSLDFATGKRDEKIGHYGLIRALKDPQKWANIFFSSMIHTVATSGKGIIAEQDAFDNIHKARDQWSSPDEIVEATPGAVANGKIMQKPPTPLPAGIESLMMQTVQSFNDVTGIPVEMLGLTKGDQAGIVEAQRKQSGIAILSWAFDGMRRLRREQARTMSEYLITYLSDGRLVRVSNEQSYVPFIRQPGMMTYDIVIDDAPTSANQQERNWAVMQMLLPVLKQMGIPVPQDLFDYLPVSEGLKESWRKQMQPNPMQQQAQQMAQQSQQRLINADASVKEADARLKDAKTQETMAMVGPSRDKVTVETQRTAAETGKIMAGA